MNNCRLACRSGFGLAALLTACAGIRTAHLEAIDAPALALDSEVADLRKAPSVSTLGPLIIAPSVQRLKLDNRMTVIVAERPDLPLVTLTYTNRAAHDDGSPATAGLTSLTAHTLNAGVIAAGGSRAELKLDGETPWMYASTVATQFELSTTPDRLAYAVWLLAQTVRKPALDAPALAAARRAELAALSNWSIETQAQLSCVARGALYGPNHYLGLCAKELEPLATEFSLSQVRTFYERHYGPRESALVVVGAVSASEVTNLAHEYFGSWQVHSAEPPVDPLPVPRPRVASSQLEVIGLQRDTDQARLGIMLPCVGSVNPDDLVLDIIATLLGNTSRPRLIDALQRAEGDTYAVEAACRERTLSGDFMVLFDSNPERAGDAVERALSEIHRLENSFVPGAELERAKDVLLSERGQRLATNDALARTLTSHYAYARPDDYEPMLEAHVRAITPQDIQRVASQYFKSTPTVVVAMGQAASINTQLGRFGRVNWVAR